MIAGLRHLHKSRFALLSQVLTLICVLILFPIEYINPFEVSWIPGSGDFEVHYIGWLFYRNTPLFGIPLFRIPDYGGMLSSSIIYTDSIPLAALIAKILSKIIDRDFQYFGLYSCLSLLLTSYFSFRYLSLNGVKQNISSVVSVLFALTPVILFRTTGHTALTSQWLIICALLLSKSNNYLGSRWALLMQVALLIHLYLFVMVFCLFCSNTLDHLIRTNERISSKQIMLGLLYVLTFIASFFIYGYLPLIPSDSTASGYGIFSTNLLSPIHPHGLYSSILPDLPTHYGSHEGLAFAGLSLLTLNLTVFFSKSSRKYFVHEFAVRKSQTACLLMLAAFSITPTIHLGLFVLDFGRLPYPLFILGDVLRASGRFAWPLFYFYYLTVASAFCVMLQKILNNTKAISISIALLLLALLDLSTFADARYDFFRKQMTNPLQGAELTVIENILLKSNTKQVIFYPNVEEPHGWNVIAPIAAKHRLATTGTYLARYNKSTMQAQNSEIYQNLLRRSLAPALYIINDAKLYSLIQDLYPACPRTTSSGFTKIPNLNCWTQTKNYNLVLQTTKSLRSGKVD